MIVRNHGFTLVEILFVITIIGIVSAIGVLGFGTITSNARDKARSVDVQQWASTFELYKSRYTVWPVLPANDTTPKTLCLGVPYSDSTTVNPNKRCGQFANSNTSLYRSTTQTAPTPDDPDYTQLKTEISKVGNMLKNSGAPLTSTYSVAGPVAYINQTSVAAGPTTNVTVNGLFFGFFENSCPSGLENLRAETRLSTFLTGLPASGAPYICGIKKDFSYISS